MLSIHMEAVSLLDRSGASLELTFCPVAAQTGNSGFLGICGIVIPQNIFYIRLSVRHKMDFSHTVRFLTDH